MAPHAVGRTATQLFWLRHLRLGFMVLMGQSATLVLYFLTSPGGHRSLLIGIAVGTTIASAVGLTGLIDHVSRQSWRETFSLAWTLSCGALLAMVVILDGSFDSPLMILLPLPVVFAGAAFGPRSVAVVGACALGEFVLVSSVGLRGPSIFSERVVWAAGVISVTCFAVAAATNRARLERSERALVCRLEEQASTDGLTGCLNNRAFMARLDEEFARAVRQGSPLTLVAVDIDDFKGVNDTFGHPTGDDVLGTVGHAVRSDLRTGDFVGRTGGDEFVIALPHTPTSGATARAARVDEHLRVAGTVPVTVSIGIAALDGAHANARQLLEDADLALYHVKHSGRTGIAATSKGVVHRIAG
jgi:diguanylate cyclase (GGDEF)-like protein